MQPTALSFMEPQALAPTAPSASLGGGAFLSQLQLQISSQTFDLKENIFVAQEHPDGSDSVLLTTPEPVSPLLSQLVAGVATLPKTPPTIPLASGQSLPPKGQALPVLPPRSVPAERLPAEVQAPVSLAVEKTVLSTAGSATVSDSTAAVSQRVETNLATMPVETSTQLQKTAIDNMAAQQVEPKKGGASIVDTVRDRASTVNAERAVQLIPAANPVLLQPPVQRENNSAVTAPVPTAIPTVSGRDRNLSSGHHQSSGAESVSLFDSSSDTIRSQPVKELPVTANIPSNSPRLSQGTPGEPLVVTVQLEEVNLPNRNKVNDLPQVLAPRGEVEIRAPIVESQPIPLPVSLTRPQSVTPIPQITMAIGLDNVDWSNAFADKVKNILKAGVNKAEIRLDPPHLGRIDVKIDLAERTVITFASEHNLVRDTLDSSSLRLREQLAEAGFNNVDVEVEQHGNRSRRDGDQAAEQQLASVRYETLHAQNDTDEPPTIHNADNQLSGDTTTTQNSVNIYV